MLTELRNRRVSDILIDGVDGLTGFPDAIESTFPKTKLQLCIVHIMRICQQWDRKFPSIGRMWRRQWPNLITIFDYPPEILTVIYTTNAIESLNSVIRKSVRKRKRFPSDAAALKLM